MFVAQLTHLLGMIMIYTARMEEEEDEEEN